MLRTTRNRRRDERGFALPLMSLLLVAMLAMAGLVVDLGSWQVEASRIQQAADAAALAGVVMLPDGDAAARQRAREVARDNGFDWNDPDVDVVVIPLPNETLEVIVTKREVPQYFTGVVRGDDRPTITRRSTSQYIQPVPLGSPRNYLGTSRLMELDHGLGGTNAVENFFLSISGECTYREFGDRITPRAMNIPGTSPHNCTPGTGGVLANPEHPSPSEPGGYFFGVSVPEASGGQDVAIQMFDAPACSGGGAVLMFGEGGAPFDVTTTVRRYDNLDPALGTLVPAPPSTSNPRTFVGEDSQTGECRFGTPSGQRECQNNNFLRECWITLAVVDEPGEYTIQIDPEFRNALTDHDNFALRAKTGATFVPCTRDTAVRDGHAATPATPGYRDDCAEVFGLEHLPLFAQGTASPIFFLASIDARHNGKTMEVTLYDSAEGASTIELLDPNGNPSQFTWEVLCADGSEAVSGTCPQGDTTPTGGRSSGGLVTVVDVSGTGTRTFGQNTQNGKYSDRLLRLSVELPSDIATAYSGATWWKIRYGGSFGGDRTTWSVKLIGDPVRLLPNN